MVVDTNVGDLEAGAEAAFLVSTSDARADAVEAAKLFSVEMEQVAGRGVLVALDRHRRIQRAQPGQTGPLEQPAYSGDAELELCGDMLYQQTVAAQRAHVLDHIAPGRPARAAAPPPRAKPPPPTCAQSRPERPPPRRRSWAFRPRSPACPVRLD